MTSTLLTRARRWFSGRPDRSDGTTAAEPPALEANDVPPGYRGLDASDFLSATGCGRLHSEDTGSVVVFLPDPFVVAGSINGVTGYSAYRGRTCHLPPAGVLELDDVLATGYGFVAHRDGVLLVDRRFTTAADELGNPLLERFAPLPGGRFSGTETPLAEEIFDEAVLLLRRGDMVYGHWLLEVIPRVALALRVASDKARFLVESSIAPYQIDMLVRLGVPRDAIVPIDVHRSYRCRKLLVPEVAHPNSGVLHPFSTRVYDELKRQAARERETATAEKLFLTRASRKQDGRQLWNAAELEETARRCGYAIVDPGAIPFLDQVNLVGAARKIIGVAGSGLHNTVFALEDASVLSIQSSHSFNTLQTAIAGARGHQIGYLIGEAFSAFGKERWEGCFMADPALLEFILTELM